MIAEHLDAMEPARQQVRLPAERARHRLGLVVVHHRGEVAPFAAAADLDHARAELEPEDQPPEQHDDDGGGRLRVGPEERGEEAGFEQQHLPAEGIEGLPDADDRHVSEPERQEADHRHPGRTELRDAAHQRRGDGDASDAQGDEPAVRVPEVTEERRAQHPSPALRRRRPGQQLRCGEQASFAEEGAELVERGDEGDEEERGDPALQHLARELEVDCREPVHLAHRTVPE